MLSLTRIGRYEVVSALGQGAMGTVYKAVDPLIERAVAIKTINLDLSKKERAEFEARFYREAKSAGRLSHAGIVTIYDVGETDDIAYIAMEYLEGESLRDMLDSGVVLPIELIASIAARLAAALSYAHENQVVHRDIKPANIMITPNRDVKILDFGIAQIPTGSRTQHGTLLGSPRYMAPEQVEGQSTDGRTDIFGLGVVLYEMLTGVAPFDGDNLSAILYKILHEEPAPPSTINARVPPVFDRIVSRALSKRPQDRYPTALAFARDLSNPDAVFFPEARGSASANTGPAKAAQASSTPAGPQDATLFLPPHKGQAGLAVPPAGNVGGVRKRMASLLGKVRQDPKTLLLALPILIIAAFVINSQDHRPGSANSAAPPATQADTATAVAHARVAPGGIASPPSPVPASTTQAKQIAKSKPKATILFAVSPWGEVYVDGRRVGVSPPLDTLQLAAGRHRVEIRNRAFAPYRATVKLTSGKTLEIRHKFK
jgi:serine/threonine-protein kinase